MSDEAPTFTVAELAATIRLALETAFPTEVWVRGEIADLNRARSGHVYFSLIEPNELGRGAAAQLPVALLADRKYVVNQILKRAGGAVRMTDGVEIRLRAKLDFYAPNGRLSLLMTLIDPAYTLGKLVADRDRLLRQLHAEGLLRRQAGLWLTPAPLRIGLVTSKGSAAEQDVLHELQRSGFGFEVRTFHAQVQGNQAPETVVRALRAAERHRCDVVALVRGGGARTDLAAFDAELIARTVAELGVPVWTGIGHEVDRSVVDEVAHQAFKTPTACATALVERVAAFLDDVERRWATIAGLATARLDGAEAELRRRSVALTREGRAALRAAEAGLTHRRERLHREATHVLQHADTRLALAAARVAAADPQRVLARGFSLTRRASDGTVVRDPGALVAGEELITETAQGSVRSTVLGDG
ncbi:MAG: exodeoxyribonuclease VII large subunit [Acidimicrobiia bacterium]